MGDLVSGLAPLIGWLTGAWAVIVPIAAILLGAASSVPIGSPTAALEGVALAGCFRYLPLVAGQAPPAEQGAIVLALLVWSASFGVMVVRLGVRRYCRWDLPSFVELSRLLCRSSSQQPNNTKS